MERKMLYLSFNSNKESGVYKKINFQEKAILKLNYIVYRSYVQNNDFYINGIKVGKYNTSDKKMIKLLRRIEVYFILKKIKHFIKEKKISILYIRHYRIGVLYFNFIKYIKKKYKIKIILEIPTYPYDNEVSSKNIGILVDKIFRVKIYKYVDRIVTYSSDKKIWNIPCINISNGIDLEEVKLAEKKQHESINFISVSNCSFWHGIDRFLYSLLQYRKNDGKEKLKFYIVGEGSESLRLRKIVEENIKLKDMVIFCGTKFGKELDEIYNNSDIAVGSLGRFRSGLTIMKTLKNREYCAKGLPMIYSEIDLDFEGQNFIYKVSHDESLINIKKLIEWYKNLKMSSEKIREYSKQFSWDIQMKKVLDEIKE